MGDVFCGVDRQTGETVAIKRLKPDIVEEMPDLLERFRREGEALRRLNHPNIVNMLAAVEEDGLHYIVMQYVGGGSLRDLLDQHPQLPVEQVLSIGIELADAPTT
jgi:serine/threonine protein kinase